MTQDEKCISDLSLFTSFFFFLLLSHLFIFSLVLFSLLFHPAYIFLLYFIFLYHSLFLTSSLFFLNFRISLLLLFFLPSVFTSICLFLRPPFKSFFLSLVFLFLFPLIFTFHNSISMFCSPSVFPFFGALFFPSFQCSVSYSFGIR